MERYERQEGIIFRNFRIGEYHKGVRVFTSENGIMDLTAYGGYKGKSRLGPMVAPITSGTFTLYRKPGIKTIKIEEFNPDNVFFDIKSNLTKYNAVLLWFEIILRSHGGGDSSAEIYSLLLESMELLESSPESREPSMTNQFLLRILMLFGYPLETDLCQICNEKTDKKSYLYFQKSHSVILCSKCRTSENTVISPGILRYIDYTMANDLSSASRILLDRNDTAQLREILLVKIQSVLECTLNTARICE